MKKFIKQIIIPLIISFLRNFEDVDETYFSKDFGLFKKAKSHIWTHAFMYTTWTALLIIFVSINTNHLVGSYIFALILYILGYSISIIIFLIETTFAPKYKLKKRLFYENCFFSLFWLVGQIVPLFISTGMLYNFYK